MKKILKVRIRLLQEPDGTVHYIYPASYNAKQITVVAYGEECLEGVERVKYCIGVVAEKHAVSFLSSAHVVEISPEEANKLGKQWRPVQLKIVDEQKLRQIISRIQKVEKLAQEDLKALDPNDFTVPGLKNTTAFDITPYLE